MQLAGKDTNVTFRAIGTVLVQTVRRVCRLARTAYRSP